MNTIDRYKILIRYAVNNNIVKSQRDLGQKLGYTNESSFSQIINGKVKTPKDFTSKLTSVFPDLNIAWLLSGEGEMLKSTTAPAKTDESKQGIPFYDIDVTASITESFSDENEEVQFYINFPPLNDCDVAFPVFGESMIPDFYPGEVVLVKEIRNIDSMLWGEPYMIITNAECDNLRTIKNVFLSEDRQNFILRASNPKYAGDTIVHRNNVIKILLVKGKVNRRQL